MVLARKCLLESEFQGQGAPRTQETTKTTGTIRTPRVGFGTDRPYIALFWDLVVCGSRGKTVHTIYNDLAEGPLHPGCTPGGPKKGTTV